MEGISMKKTALSLVALGLLTGCSSLRVNTDFAEGTNFAKFKTFQYKESTNTVATSSPLSHQRIVAAIKRGMTTSGMTEVEENPDVHVTYYGSSDQDTHFHTTYSGVNTWSGTGRNSTRMGFGVTSSTTRPTTVTRGTLIIDIWDASENAMLWRSVATSTLSSSPERNAKTINSAVEKAFESFPPQQ
jgi:hypothetical protein